MFEIKNGLAFVPNQYSPDHSTRGLSPLMLAAHADALRHIDNADVGQRALCGHVDGLPEDVVGMLTGRRADAFGGENGALALATTARGRVLTEERKRPLTAFKLFPINGEVPLGATKYTVPYISMAGEAAIWKAGVNIPKVNVGAFEDEFGVAYLITSWESTFPEMLGAKFAQSNIGISVATEANKMRAATRALDELANRISWFGSPENQIYGIANYPRLQKYTSSVAFDGTAAPADVAFEISALFNYAMNNSGGALFSVKLAASPRVRNYLYTTRLNTVTGQTIGMFLEETLKCGAIEWAPELIGVGGTGIDGVIAYSDNADECAITVIQAPTVLPPVMEGIRTVTYMYSVVGGACLRIPGTCSMMLVNV